MYSLFLYINHIYKVEVKLNYTLINIVNNIIMMKVYIHVYIRI